MNKESTTNTANALLSRKEAAGYIGNMSVRYLDEKTRAREIACVRFGRAVRYRREDLDAFIASRLVRSEAA